MAKLSGIKVEIGIPSIGKIEGTWEPDEHEEQAAWELYVELITRISTVELTHEAGLLRESLSSLNSLFPTTRAVLREHGPSVARLKRDNVLSLGYLSITVLNLVLRPFLSKWHPLLLDYETTKPIGTSPLAHERNWTLYIEFREALRTTQAVLLEYADVLAKVANVPSLVLSSQEQRSDAQRQFSAPKVNLE